MSTTSTIEYRVVELSQDTDDSGYEPFWFEHGGKFEDRDLALETLAEMTGRYSQYGRVFRLEKRHVTDWESYGGD